MRGQQDITDKESDHMRKERGGHKVIVDNEINDGRENTNTIDFKLRMK